MSIYTMVYLRKIKQQIEEEEEKETMRRTTLKVSQLLLEKRTPALTRHKPKPVDIREEDPPQLCVYSLELHVAAADDVYPVQVAGTQTKHPEDRDNDHLDDLRNQTIPRPCQRPANATHL
jgi:hypothetical protein